MFFIVPDESEKYTKIEDGKKFARVSTSCWFTSLPVTKHQEKLILWKSYSAADYPKYDNYDAINVGKYTDIPNDYSGIMGVPITFLDKYNPAQFEIIGMESSAGYDAEIVGIPLLKDGDARPTIDGKTTYARIFIQRRYDNG